MHHSLRRYAHSRMMPATLKPTGWKTLWIGHQVTQLVHYHSENIVAQLHLIRAVSCISLLMDRDEQASMSMLESKILPPILRGEVRCCFSAPSLGSGRYDPLRRLPTSPLPASTSTSHPPHPHPDQDHALRLIYCNMLHNRFTPVRAVD